MLLLMGPASSVEAIMDTRFSKIESEDYVRAKITFKSGREARCTASVNSGFLGSVFQIQGTEGTATLSGDISTSDPARGPKAIAALDAARWKSVPSR